MKGRVIPETTDLFFGQQRELTDNNLKDKFGQYYSLSVGALSITTEGEARPIDLFEDLAKWAFKSNILGDIAYIEGGALREPIIVLSNNRYMIYNSQFVNKFIPHIYTKSFNGGITVQRHFIKF